MSIAFSLAFARTGLECCSSTSSICCPTLRIGFSAARGFWKIIEISRPRRSPISSSPAARRSMPENVIAPVGNATGAVENAHHRIGRDRLAGAGFADDAERLALADTDVDVAARPCTVPRRVANSTVRSWTSRSGW